MSIKRAKELIKSNYGRNFGWYIEFNGIVIGTLSDPKYSDMFWEEYTISPTSNDTNSTLMNKKNWDQGKFKYRNMQLNEYAELAIPGKLEAKKIIMRSLYLLPKGLIEKLYCNIYSLFK